jgi:hypothetical protein
MCQESTPPVCPACGAPAIRAVRGKGRWACREPGCPVSEFAEAYPSRPGQPARPGPRPPGGPAAAPGDQEVRPGSRGVEK